MLRSRRTYGLVLLSGILITSILTVSPISARAGTTVQDESVPAFQVRSVDRDATARTLEWLRTEPTSPRTGKIWVYFTDKNVFDSETCEARLEEARVNLSEPARARRAKVLGTGLVDFLDIPVHADYVEAIADLGAEIVHTSRWFNAVSVRASIDDLERISTLPFVQKLVPVRGFKSSYPTPEQSHSGGQSLLGASGARDTLDYGESYDQLNEIQVVAAHDLGYSGDGVIVSMHDTGFMKSHETFAAIISDGRLLAEWDFVNGDGNTENEGADDPDSHNHGTFTWSALGGFTEGELIGPAYGASFLLAKTEDITDETPVEEDNWVAAAEWGDTNGANVISSSLSYLDWYTYEDMDGDTALITIASDIAASRGIVVCNSAGNQGTQDWYYITAPSDGDSVISVGALDWNGVIADFSSHGPTYDGRTKPEVCARGVDTYCALPPDLGASYWWISGTSLSCPLVGGCAALVMEAHPEWTMMQVREALMMTAANAANPDNDYGWGRVNVVDAMDYVVGVEDGPAGGPIAAMLRAAPNPLTRSTTMHVRLPHDAGAGRVDIYDVQGRRVRSLPMDAGASVVAWDARDAAGIPVSPGVYLVDLRAGEWRITTKLVVQR